MTRLVFFCHGISFGLRKQARLTGLSLGMRLSPVDMYPASSSAFWNGARPLSSSAISRGVFPDSSFASRSAPASMRCRMATRFPLTAAQCKGVIRALSCVLTEAPCRMSKSTEMASPAVQRRITDGRGTMLTLVCCPHERSVPIRIPLIDRHRLMQLHVSLRPRSDNLWSGKEVAHHIQEGHDRTAVRDEMKRVEAL